MRTAFSLIETAMSTILVSLLMAVSMSTFAHVTATTQRDNHNIKAAQLAQLLLAEVTSKCFEDPDALDAGNLGLESDESSTDRSTWDDFDDYAGLRQRSIVDADGKDITWAAGWSARFAVNFCDPTDPANLLRSAADMKAVQLTLMDPAGATHTFSAYRSKYGVFQQSQLNDFLCNAEVNLQSGNQRWSTGTRVLNQQDTR